MVDEVNEQGDVARLSAPSNALRYDDRLQHTPGKKDVIIPGYFTLLGLMSDVLNNKYRQRKVTLAESIQYYDRLIKPKFGIIQAVRRKYDPALDRAHHLPTQREQKEASEAIRNRWA